MNLELVEQIVSVLEEYPLSEITVEQEGRRVSVHRPVAAWTAARPVELLATAELETFPVPQPFKTLSATMVGVFHHADPPVAYAAVITPGQRVGFIESMKLMNDVSADEGGRVTEILVEDGAPVEYGQALFRLSSE